jgi:hypothetical protein
VDGAEDDDCQAEDERAYGDGDGRLFYLTLTDCLCQMKQPASSKNLAGQ